MKVTRQFKDFFESEIMGETGFSRCKTKIEIRVAVNNTYKIFETTGRRLA